MAARKSTTSSTQLTPQPDARSPLEEEVFIESIRMNLMAPTRVVFLKSKSRERVMPIIVGNPEADAIAIALQKKQMPRPMTHDLMLDGFGELGASVTRVVVSGLEGETFFAQVHLDLAGQPKSLDARPSDGFALAVRAGAPIFVATDVMERSGIESLHRTESGAYSIPADLPPTERMQKVIALAHQEMARFGRDRIGGEHALLGMLVEGNSVASNALAKAGIELATARTAVATLCGFGDKSAPKAVPADPANPKLKELVEEEAARLGHRWLGTEHLLLALLREEDGVVPAVLEHLGVTPDAVREHLMASLRELEQTSAGARGGAQTS